MVVIKRNGNVVPFDKLKITSAIRKAMVECNVDPSNAEYVTEDVVKKLDDEYVEIEDIQDEVEDSLMKLGFRDVAKSYILYRQKRKETREHPIDESILGILNRNNIEVLTENSNKQGEIVSTQRDLMAGEVSKHLAKTKMIPKDIIDAHNKGIIHIHDLDYYANPETNCIEQNAWLYIKDDKGIKYIQFKDLDKLYGVNEGLNVVNDKVYVLGRNGWTKLIAINKRYANEDIYTFRTRTGLKLKTTKNHKIPVIREGKEELLFAKDINKHDVLLTANGMKLNPYEFDSKDFINFYLNKLKFII